jgi:hypothetical protein
MRFAQLTAAAIAIALVSCGGLVKTDDDLVRSSNNGFYAGSASVGDFVQIEVDYDRMYISYRNLTNGTSGASTFTINPLDESLVIDDPSCGLEFGYEIPGYALVLKATNTGPAANETCIVTSINKETTTVADIAGHSYNYMQFRTNSGGMEIGCVQIDNSGAIDAQGYWPYGSTTGTPEPFPSAGSGEGIPAGENDAETGAVKVHEAGEGDFYIFRTTGGFFAVDTPNGAIIGLQQASGTAFKPSDAGIYKAVIYMKQGATTGSGNVETPTQGSVERVTITVGTDGAISVSDEDGNELANIDLEALADDASIVPNSGGETMASGIGNSCPGLFKATDAVTAPDGSPQEQQIFVTFIDDALLFCSFTPQPTIGDPSEYDYFYGVALKQAAGND